MFNSICIALVTAALLGGVVSLIIIIIDFRRVLRRVEETIAAVKPPLGELTELIRELKNVFLEVKDKVKSQRSFILLIPQILKPVFKSIELLEKIKKVVSFFSRKKGRR
jgi:hypothetical protein